MMGEEAGASLFLAQCPAGYGLLPSGSACVIGFMIAIGVFGISGLIWQYLYGVGGSRHKTSDKRQRRAP